MTVHLVTEEVTVRSQITVTAPPGERPVRVVDMAMEQVRLVREQVGLLGAPTDMSISEPVYADGRRWHITITESFRSTELIKVKQ